MAYLTKVIIAYSKEKKNHLLFSPIDLETSDKLNEFFASENGFALQRLLSEVNPNDVNIELNDLFKFDSTKILESRTLSEFVSGKKTDRISKLHLPVYFLVTI